MLYRFLGILVWKAAKWFLKRRYGALRAPKPVLAGAVLALLAAVGGVVLGLFRRAGSADSED